MLPVKATACIESYSLDPTNVRVQLLQRLAHNGMAVNITTVEEYGGDMLQGNVAGQEMAGASHFLLAVQWCSLDMGVAHAITEILADIVVERSARCLWYVHEKHRIAVRLEHLEDLLRGKFDNWQHRIIDVDRQGLPGPDIQWLGEKAVKPAVTRGMQILVLQIIPLQVTGCVTDNAPGLLESDPGRAIPENPVKTPTAAELPVENINVVWCYFTFQVFQHPNLSRNSTAFTYNLTATRIIVVKLIARHGLFTYQEYHCSNE